MIFDVVERDIVSFGAIKKRKIGLSANAKAFRIIFGQIYPDIIKAIVRELFTNAWDSQKTAGTLDKAIEIHLPTGLEPYFGVRDFGVGLSPQQMEDVYFEVFESSKDTSNDEAGQFGMGSKTPLGYTDQFTLTSYIDGTMWSYQIYIDEMGEPIGELIYEGETTEPNGVDVRVAVNKNDFESFKAHAELFAMNSGALVEINRKRVLNVRRELMSGENWVLYEPKAEYSLNEGLYIKMGCVLYKLNMSLFNSTLPGYYGMDYDIRNKLTKYLGLNLIINFDIGTFEVTSSREDIIYNANASQSIYDKLINEIIPEIQHNITGELTLAPNFGDVYQLHRMYQNMGIDISDNIKWKSWSINKAHNYTSMQRTKSEYNLNPFSKSKNIIRSYTPCSLQHDILYMSDAVTYVILDDNKTNKMHSRLQNFVMHLKNAGLIPVYGYKKPDQTYFNILWVKTEKSNLKRLHTILPSRHYIINAEDIIPLKITREKKEGTEKKPILVKHLRIHEETGDIMVNNYHSQKPHSEYFVNTYRARPVEVEDEIRIAAAVLGVKISDIVAIGKQNWDAVTEFDLKNLITEAENKRNSISFNQSTIFHFVCEEIRNHHDHGVKRSFAFAKNTLAKWLDIDYNKNDVVYTYSKNVNKDVCEVHDKMLEMITDKIDKLIEENPLLHFIDPYKFSNADNLTKILTITGEMK